MRSCKKLGGLFLAVIMSVGIFSACGGKSGKQTLSEKVVGIWAMEKTYIDQMDITNPNNWFDFHKDGTVDTRAGDAPDKFQSGNWTINEKDSTLKMESKEHGTMTYKLNFKDDKLNMTAPTSGKTLKVIAVRSEKKPEPTK